MLYSDAQPGLQGFRHIVRDLFVNLLTSEHEDTYEFEGEFFDDHDEYVARRIQRSLRQNMPLRLRQSISEEELQLGFEYHTDDLSHEVALVAVSEQRSPNRFKHLAASQGTANRVSPPMSILPLILERVRKHIPTRVLLYHNHPESWLANIVEELTSLPPGPSGQDRTAAQQWQCWFDGISTTVKAELMLLENGHWRPITMPGAGDRAQLAQLLLLLLQDDAQQ